MNVLVTGGAGFVGSHVVDRLLTEGHNVIVVDRSHDNIVRNLGVKDALSERAGLRIYCCDINNINNIDGLGPVDYIIHLAAVADVVPSIENPEEYHRSNVDGTLEVLRLAQKQKTPIKKFIYAASSSCYGNNPPLPTQESAPIDCKYPYALTKWVGEEYVMHWHKVYALPTISLRLFNVYGPRSRTSGAYGAVFGVFLKQKLANKPYTVVGTGDQSRDFIYVDDVVDVFLLALKSDRVGQIYNVGTGHHVTIRNLVNQLGQNHGVEFLPDRPGEPRTTMAWIGKIQGQLRWNPKTSFNAGVKVMLSHIDDYEDAPLWNKDNIKIATKSWFENVGRTTV